MRQKTHFREVAGQAGTKINGYSTVRSQGMEV